MKNALAIFLSLFLINAAHADEIPVKDRCGNKAVLVTLFEIMERFYPPRYEDKTSFVFDPESVLTREYDANLNKVICMAKFVLYVDLMDTRNKTWVSTLTKAGIKKLPKMIMYEMQYVSGSTERFNVGIRETIGLDNSK